MDFIKIIYATDGTQICVDDEDYEYLNQFNWTFDGERYAVTNISGKFTSMHRLICELNNIKIPKGYIVDHKDGIGIKNIKSNLRVCTQSHNQMNKAKTKSKRTSKFKGVCFEKQHNKWNATIEKTIDGKRKKYNLGLFENEELAARVYDVNALKLFGEYARTNFPNSDYINNNEYESYIRIDKEIKTSSKFKYVYWMKNISKWAVEIHHNKIKHRLGYFDDERDAAKTANNFIIENKLNKILNEV